MKNFAKGIFWLITTNFYDTMTCYNYSLISRPKLSIKYMFRALKLLWNSIIGQGIDIPFTHHIDQILHNHNKYIYMNINVVILWEIVSFRYISSNFLKVFYFHFELFCVVITRPNDQNPSWYELCNFDPPIFSFIMYTPQVIVNFHLILIAINLM